MALLSIKDISLSFGGIKALDGVGFDVEPGQICALIGPNGAGKSSVFNCLSRLYPFRSGSIDFDGQALAGVPRHAIAPMGIGRTFQNLALFKSMTVLDNILVGGHSRYNEGFLRNAVRWPSVARTEQLAVTRAQEAIEFLSLQDVASRPVGELPFGTQKRVELARALVSQPKLLLLDEPACGLNHEELGSLAALIRDIRDRLHVTVLLVEHNMNLVMGISDKVVAMNFGRKIAEGTPAEVRAHPEVIKAYLGDGT